MPDVHHSSQIKKIDEGSENYTRMRSYSISHGDIDIFYQEGQSPPSFCVTTKTACDEANDITGEGKRIP